MAPAFGNSMANMPFSAVCLVLVTLLFTMGAGMITDGIITPTAEPITAKAQTVETGMEPIAPITRAEVKPQPGVVKTKTLKTKSAVESKEAPAELAKEVVPDHATAVDPAVADVDLAVVNNPKTKQNDYRDPQQRMGQRPSPLQYLFGKFPTPTLPW